MALRSVDVARPLGSSQLWGVQRKSRFELCFDVAHKVLFAFSKITCNAVFVPRVDVRQAYAAENNSFINYDDVNRT